MKIGKLFKNNIMLFTLISILTIFVISFHNFDKKTKSNIKKIIYNPNILLLILLFIGVCSYYHFPLGILFMLSLLVIISDKDNNIESFENKANNKSKNNTNNNTNNNLDEDNYDDDDITDNDIDDNIERNNKAKNKRKKETSDVNIDLTKGNHYFSKMISLDLDDMKKHILSDSDEDRKNEILDKIKTLKKNNQNVSSSSKNLEIPKRKFNLDNDEDMNLLNTREICKDIINRINFKYEDNDYLKKYIGTRIEEIVDLNGLLNE